MNGKLRRFDRCHYRSSEWSVFSTNRHPSTRVRIKSIQYLRHSGTADAEEPGQRCPALEFSRVHQ